MSFNLNDIFKEANEAKLENVRRVVGHEAISKEVEREFCIWAENSNELTEQLLNKEGVESYFYVDFLLKTSSSKIRRRTRIKGGAGVYTMKLMQDDGSRIEENTDLTLLSSLPFYFDSEIIHVCRRFKWAEPSIEGASWDVDLFIPNPGRSGSVFHSVENFNAFMEELETSASYGELVKVELEMKKEFADGMTVDSLAELSGLPITKKWSSKTEEPDVRTMLDNYWDHVTDF